MPGRHAQLEADFYGDDDVVAIARALLGKVLATAVDGRLTRAVITETEAYAGVTDRASHAFGGRRTRRTEPLFKAGGIAYVYLCYGIHHLFNVVTGPEDVPHAILVRAGAPLEGVDTMLERRGRERVDARLMAGPGTLSSALGIRTSMTGTPLDGDTIWLEDHGIGAPANRIITGPRVGIDYAGRDAALPYRFRLTPSALKELDGAA